MTLEVARLLSRAGRIAPLIAAMAAVTALWAYYPHAFIPSDELGYAKYAHGIRIGSYFRSPPQDIFAHRIGVLLPVAGVYAIAGVTQWTTDFVPLCATLAILVLVWMALPDQRSRTIAAICFAGSAPILRASVDLMPDIIAAAFMTASVLALSTRNRFADQGPRVLLRVLGAAGAAACFYAFLCKESAYWVVPLWLGALLVDIRGRRRLLLLHFHVPSILLGLVLAAGYLYASKVLFGHPMARFRTLQALSGQHLWAWTDRKALHDRVLFGWVMFFWKEYGLVAVCALLSWATLPREMRLWGYFAACSVLLFSFGSTALTSYQPLPLASRMALPCAPGLLICAAQFLSQVSIQSVPGRWSGATILCALLLASSAVAASKFVASWVPDYEAAAMAAVRTEWSGGRALLFVTSDHRSAESLSIYFQFRPPKNLKLVFAGDLTPELVKPFDRAVLYTNEALSKFLVRSYHAREYSREIELLRTRPVYSQQGWRVSVANQRQLADLARRVRH